VCFVNDRNHGLLIGLSPRLMRHVPAELGFRGKTLQYLEQSMAHWLMRAGAMVAMIPTVEARSDVSEDDLSVDDYAHTFDGLVLQGGADIDPAVYGREPDPHLGPTDRVRDEFELRLLSAFVARDKPVLGVCRGMQLINVAHGGTLHQDLVASFVTAIHHHVPEQYDAHMHRLRYPAGGWMDRLFPDASEPCVNSIHHQGIDVLGEGLVAEAWSEDGIIECIRRPDAAFVVGVQWHPEFHDSASRPLLPGAPLLREFFRAARP
jgi:gamma-glutamyl-gamma-aminobutyrate hydrolase PuuD